MDASGSSSSYPRGWFAVACASTLAREVVRTEHFFGRDIVLFRTASGQARAIQSWCPHLGTHLGTGTVVGDTVRCAFHGWRFDGGGRCVALGRPGKVPPGAHASAWQVRERRGMIFVWHDPHGGPPDHEVEELPTDGWTPLRVQTWTGRYRCDDVIENAFDAPHHAFVHHSDNPRIVRAPRFAAASADLVLSFERAGDEIGFPGQTSYVELHTEALGLGILRFHTKVPEHGIETLHCAYITPIDDHTVHVWGTVSTRALPDPDFTEWLYGQMFAAFVREYGNDHRLLQGRRHLEVPALAAGDRPIADFRRWARRFYAPTSSTSREAPALDEHSELEGEPIAAPARARSALRESVVRVASVAEYIDSLPQRFVASAAADVDAVVQWTIEGAEGASFFASIDRGRLRVERGEHEAPSVHLRMQASDFVRVVNGEKSGMPLFVLGKARLRGDYHLALRLQQILPPRRA